MTDRWCSRCSSSICRVRCRGHREAKECCVHAFHWLQSALSAT